MLASLLETGHLEQDHLARLTRERVLSSLLPLVWCSALVNISGAAAHPVLPLTSADAMQSVSAAERHAGQLSQAERALSLEDRFVASPLTSAQAVGSQDA